MITTKKQLGELLLENMPLYFTTGLCKFIKELCSENIITINEYIFILDLIGDYEENLNVYEEAVYDDTGHYWPQGDEEPRIKWINDNLINAEQ